MRAGLTRRVLLCNAGQLLGQLLGVIPHQATEPMECCQLPEDTFYAAPGLSLMSDGLLQATDYLGVTLDRIFKNSTCIEDSNRDAVPSLCPGVQFDEKCDPLGRSMADFPLSAMGRAGFSHMGEPKLPSFFTVRGSFVLAWVLNGMFHGCCMDVAWMLHGCCTDAA